MGRLNKILVALFVFGLLAIPLSVNAQNGACPPNTSTLGTAGGSSPADLEYCANNLYAVWIDTDTDGNYPCSQQIITSTGVDAWYPSIYIVPDSSQHYGEEIRVRFMFWGESSLSPPGATQDNVTVRMMYFSTDGTLYSYIDVPATTYTAVSTFYDWGVFNRYYLVYLVDQTLPVSEPAGGYIAVKLYEDNAEIVSNIWTASYQVGNVNDYFPEYCALPVGSLPATPGPGPTATGTIPATWTPLPAGTQTPTPHTTPQATATGVAPLPTWTPTPLVFATIASEPTPTPWAPVAISTVVWPSPFPTLVAMDTQNSTREAGAAGINALIENINNSWSTPVAAGQPFADPENTIAISSTSTIQTFMSQYIGVPVGYLRGVPLIMPNAWQYVVWLFYLAVFVLFVRYGKVSLGIAKFVFELVRRGWEMLPFN